jgi:hypothetical protein
MEGVAERKLSVGPEARTAFPTWGRRLSNFVEAQPGDLTSSAQLLEVRMRRIVHHELGKPSELLRVEEGPSEPLGPNQVPVRVSCAPSPGSFRFPVLPRGSSKPVWLGRNSGGQR